LALSDCRILVTGANGFIGKNLVIRLNELVNVSVTSFVRGDDTAFLPYLLTKIDCVVHLAGENRPLDESAFSDSNTVLTSILCSAIEKEYAATGRHIPLVFTSSIQVECDNPYGRSKLAAERAVHLLSKTIGNPCIILRLPGVFGKWCKPDYNSVVATFCHNIARDLPIQINDSATVLRLVYIDDVVDALLSALDYPVPGLSTATVTPEYTVTLGELAEQIRAFAYIRTTLISGRVGTGFVRALYATYVSYLPIERFSYQISQFKDSRGVFVEMLKTSDSGQFSYFTAYPGVTRGGHYHHTKTEKFLVIKGEARFRFRQMHTGEMHELVTSGSKAEIVETVPGWTHDITNIGNDEMVVMLWANEVFDRSKPDTYACPL